MVSPDAVLAVIRASRPSFKSAHERAMFVVHATFLASGYSLVAAGSKALSASTELHEDEASLEGWNDMEDAYVFRYAGTHPDLWGLIEVKGTSFGDILMVDASPIMLEGTNTIQPCHLAIKVTDFTTEGEGKSYASQYKNLLELVNLITTTLIEKLKKSSEPSTTSSVGVKPEEREQSHICDEADQSSQPDKHSTLFRFIRPCFRPIPAFGGSDLLPGPGAGVPPPRRDPSLFGGPGGALLGPNDPMWARMGPDREEFPGHGLPAGLPPGARFDPYGPPGVPGFEPTRFGRGSPHPRGQPHPDLQHFPPF